MNLYVSKYSLAIIIVWCVIHLANQQRFADYLHSIIPVYGVVINYNCVL